MRPEPHGNASAPSHTGSASTLGSIPICSMPFLSSSAIAPSSVDRIRALATLGRSPGSLCRPPGAQALSKRLCPSRDARASRNCLSDADSRAKVASYPTLVRNTRREGRGDLSRALSPRSVALSTLRRSERSCAAACGRRRPQRVFQPPAGLTDRRGGSGTPEPGGSSPPAARDAAHGPRPSPLPASSAPGGGRTRPRRPAAPGDRPRPRSRVRGPAIRWMRFLSPLSGIGQMNLPVDPIAHVRRVLASAASS